MNDEERTAAVIAAGLPAEIASAIAGDTTEEIAANAAPLLGHIAELTKGDRRPDFTLGQIHEPAPPSPSEWLRNAVDESRSTYL